MTWMVHRMWRVLEKKGGHRRGTFTLCLNKLPSSEDISGTKGIVDFDEGTRIDGGSDGRGPWGVLVVEPFEDQEGKPYDGSIRMGPYDFKIMRELPVTAPTIHQHVVSAAVIPRLGDPARRKKR